MKRLPFYLLALTHAFAADEPAKKTTPEDWIIHVEFTAITLPEKTVLPLLLDLGDEQKEQAAIAKIEAALAKGEGKLEGKQHLVTTNGVRKVAESLVEVRYPAGFNIPDYPRLDSVKEINSLKQNSQTVFFTPTSFETRNTGLTIETEPQVSADGKWLSILAGLNHTRFLQWDEYGGGVTPQGVKMVMQQPRFATAKDQLTLVVRSGSSSLAGIHTLPDQPKKMELFFIRAWTTRKPPGSEAATK